MNNVNKYINELKNIKKIPQIKDSKVWEYLNEEVGKKFKIEFCPMFFDEKPDIILKELSIWLNMTLNTLIKDKVEKVEVSADDKMKLKNKAWKELLSYKTKPQEPKERCESKVFADHLSKIYEDRYQKRELIPIDNLQIGDWIVTEPFKESPVTTEELELILNGSNKSKDRYGLSYNDIKMLPSIHSYICKIFTKLLSTDELDVSWTHARLFMKYKRGDPTLPQNYRPMTMLSTMTKLFHKILNVRLSAYLENNKIIDRSIQKGLQKRISGVLENTIINKRLIDDAKSNEKPLSMLFLDVTNAYGSLRHPFIQTAMEIYKVPKSIIKYIMKFYHQATVQVTSRNGDSNPFVWQKGVFQGCSLANMLFIMCMNVLLIHLDKKYRDLGYELNDIKTLLMSFIDDLMISTSKMEDTKTVLDELQRLFTWCGFKLKPEKSHLLQINQEKDGFVIDDVKVKEIGEECNFKYLGSIVTESEEDKICDTFIEEMREHLESIENMKIGTHQINNYDKFYLYKTHVVPKITWAFKINTWGEDAMERVETLERKYLDSWMKEKWSEKIFTGRRDIVAKQKEYIYKCSLDNRISGFSEEIYGEITQEERDDLRKTRKEERFKNNKGCPVYTEIESVPDPSKQADLQQMDNSPKTTTNSP
jgi:hypothetical protein